MTDKPTITQGDKTALDEAVMECVLGDLINGQVIIAKHRESAVAEFQAEVERMREALQMAAKQFRFYEDSHLLKETTDGIAKAVTNRRCAEQCEIALAQKEPVE